MKGKHRRKSSKIIDYCRTCLVEIKSQLFIDMKKTQGKWKDLSLLENCLFEMDSNLTSDCNVCQMCLYKLEEMYKFKINSMKTEERIIAYLKENPLDSDMKLNLQEVVSIKEPNNETGVLPVKKECVENICINNYSCDNNLIKKEKDELNNYLNSLESEFKDQADSVKTLTYDYEEIIKEDSSGKKVYCCPLKNCLVVSRYRYNIRRHLKKVHYKKTKHIVTYNKLFKCTKCEFTSTMNYIETTKHRLSHANTDIYKCTKCPYTNDKKTEFIRHIFSHVTDKTLKNYRTLDQ